MSMDIISGMVITTAAFMIALSVALFVVGPKLYGVNEEAAGHVLGALRTMLATLVAIYFVATTHLLLIAQQMGLALGNFVIALVLLALLYGEAFLHMGRRRQGNGDN